ncbi:MAG: nitroreductase family deazaflavin-dependent oxidoreductase [Dehalococcoidia bacterium]
MPPLSPTMSDEDYCYLTTTGRTSGRPHTIEIWFGLTGGTLYLLAGGGERADWVRNLRRTPRVTVRIQETIFTGAARVIDGSDEDRHARALLVTKYGPRDQSDLTNWGRRALPIAIDLDLS